VDQALWVVPGAVEQRLTAAGFTAAPLTRRRASVRAPRHVSGAAGDDVTVSVRVTHPPGDAPWPSVADVVDAKGAVRVVATWPARAAATAVGDLPRTLLPSESSTVSLVLRLPSKPGTYEVTLSVLEDPGRVFTGTATISVRVH
jgi:hypothetical protein